MPLLLLTDTFVALHSRTLFDFYASGKAMKKFKTRDESGPALPSFGERIAHLNIKRQELVRPLQERPGD